MFSRPGPKIKCELGIRFRSVGELGIRFRSVDETRFIIFAVGASFSSHGTCIHVCLDHLDQWEYGTSLHRCLS